MPFAPDLGIPESTPPIESVRGRWWKKMSPQTRHALLQGRLFMILSQWANGRGDVGTEWRFYLLAPDEPPSSLVPDVAYVAAGRLAPEAGDARERPVMAPDIAVEILSPDDRLSLLETKIALYFKHHCSVVIVVDPSTRTIRIREQGADQTFSIGEICHCESFPDLTLDITALFERII